MADELHRQYVLGFDVPVLDGLVHTLDVQVKLPRMTVRARKSYVAAPGRANDTAAPSNSRMP